ncbi:MAG: hypothetical protein H6973_04350 [Gammaproteobacteria bacterium]|nr:hypothetical protein [Gammaproteobacteria bacterium]
MSPVIQDVLNVMKAHFPRLSDWDYHEQADPDYRGLTVWGAYAPDPDALTGPCYFVTVTQVQGAWRDDFTVGKPACCWSSANVGDAQLLDTPECATLEEAITALKQAIRQFVDVFAGEG